MPDKAKVDSIWISKKQSQTAVTKYVHNKKGYKKDTNNLTQARGVNLSVLADFKQTEK